VILTYGNTHHEAEAYANADVARIENWAKENKMQFNESKSKAMIITRKRRRAVQYIRGVIDCNEWKTGKRHIFTNMGKVKRIEL
jgi:hypothetical protein